MKLFSIICLFGLVSCAQEQQKAIGTVNEVRNFEPITVSYEDSAKIQAICGALSSKAEVLDILVNNGTEYTFDYSQKGCDDKEPSEIKQVVATIQPSAENFIFKTKNGEAFGFSDVETSEKGIMAEICQNNGHLMNPIQTSRSGAIWFTSFPSARDCQSDAYTACMYIQRGTVIEGTQYQIHTNEWVKFKVNGDKRGFFIERKMISSAGCGAGKTLSRQAVLK